MAKSKRRTGYLLELEQEFDFDDISGEITDAIVSSNALSIDWTENGGPWHLTAKSFDEGETYKGVFDDLTNKVRYDARILRFDSAKGGILLIVHWEVPSSGDYGACLFDLPPT